MLKYKDETIGIGKVDLSCVNDLKMLGYTVPSECPIQNYTDANGVFHQRVGRVDLGTLNWTYDSSSEDRKYFYAPLTGSKAKGICYTKNYTYNGTSAIKDKQVMVFSNSNVIIKDLTYSDATTFKSAMAGQYLYYELATEVTKSVDGNEYVIEELSNLIGYVDIKLDGTVVNTETNGLYYTYILINDKIPSGYKAFSVSLYGNSYENLYYYIKESANGDTRLGMTSNKVHTFGNYGEYARVWYIKIN